MYITRVSELKSGKRHSLTRALPKPGTKSRELWDALHEGPVEIRQWKSGHSFLETFRLFYGLDLVSPERGFWQAK